MLILETRLELKSKHRDVTVTFLCADLEENEKVYVEMPLGFRKKGKVLKLKKNSLRFTAKPQDDMEVPYQGYE